MRGGVSFDKIAEEIIMRSSPRAWGCFLGFVETSSTSIVFPTCVGVFPAMAILSGIASRLPHVRGGVSSFVSCQDEALRSSPRAWGCFPGVRHEIRDGPVFPTCVGVFLTPGGSMPVIPGLPHVRGGVSMRQWRYVVLFGSSPRAWGCFLF